jgi:hypothetical protein
MHYMFIQSPFAVVPVHRQAEEHIDIIRRRARWSSQLQLEAYLQECTPGLFMKQLDPEVRVQLSTVASALPEVLKCVFELLERTPCSVWPTFFFASGQAGSWSGSTFRRG